MTVPDDASTASGASSRIKDELTRLRERGTVKTERGKYKSSDGKAGGLMTPEEAKAYLAAQRVAQSRKSKEAPKPPTNLASADLDSWFLRQKKREAEERLKREEAEKILRGYKGHWISPNEQGGGFRDNLKKTGGGGAAGEIDGNSIDARGFFRDAEASSAGAGWMPVLPGDSFAEATREEEEKEAEEKEVESASAEGAGAPETTTEETFAPPADDAKERGEEMGEESNAEGDAEREREDASSAAEDGPPAEEAEEEAREDDAEEAPEAEAGTSEEAEESAVEEETPSAEIRAGRDGAGAGAPSADTATAIDDLDEVEEEKKTEDEDAAAAAAVAEKEAGASRKDRIDASIFVGSSYISSEEGALYPPESGRYTLVVSYACPWSHRTLLVRALKGLEDAVPVCAAKPVWERTRTRRPDDADDDDSGGEDGHRGWVFPRRGEEGSSEEDGGVPMGAASVRELYERAMNSHQYGTGKYTLPLLWDTQTSTIVSVESSDVMRMLDSCMNDYATNASLDLYPEEKRGEIDGVNGWMGPSLNNGVYRCGFATTQSAYDSAMDDLVRSWDRIETTLKARGPFLLGDSVTEADVRLFVTLLRFDEVYATYFKCNARSVGGSPIMLEYCRRMYRIAPGVAETCDMDQIKKHYYCSHVELNRFSIVPRGPDFMRLLEEEEDS